MKNDVKLTTRLFILIISFVSASALFLSVATLGDSKDKGFSFSSSTEGVYVIENLNLDYRYDKTKYEVVPFITEPYAVVKGSKQLINLLKWSGKPEFFIELSGKLPGTYREQVQFTGINENLQVEIYPSIVDLRLMEQQTIKIIPTIELTGQENVHEDYIVSVPELLSSEGVMLRDIQDKLNQVGQVKGIIDVSKMTKTQEVKVTLKVYDRDGNPMPGINLIDKTIQVKVPIEKKVTIIKEEIINEIVIVEEPKEEPEKEPKDEPKGEPTKQPNDSKPSQEGVLAFINIPKDLTLANTTTEKLKWSGDVKIDLKAFKAGEYEMTVDDKGAKKTVKFTLTQKGKPKEEDTEDTEVDKEKPTEPTPPEQDKNEQIDDTVERK